MISIGVIRFVINITTAVWSVDNAWQFRKDKRLSSRGMAWFLFGSAAYNAGAAALYLYTQLPDVPAWPIDLGVSYAILNSFETVPSLILNLILRGHIRAKEVGRPV